MSDEQTVEKGALAPYIINANTKSTSKLESDVDKKYLFRVIQNVKVLLNPQSGSRTIQYFTNFFNLPNHIK